MTTGQLVFYNGICLLIFTIIHLHHITAITAHDILINNVDISYTDIQYR